MVLGDDPISYGYSEDLYYFFHNEMQSKMQKQRFCEK